MQERETIVRELLYMCMCVYVCVYVSLSVSLSVPWFCLCGL